MRKFYGSIASVRCGYVTFAGDVGYYIKFQAFGINYQLSILANPRLQTLESWLTLQQQTDEAYRVCAREERAGPTLVWCRNSELIGGKDSGNIEPIP